MKLRLIFWVFCISFLNVNFVIAPKTRNLQDVQIPRTTPKKKWYALPPKIETIGENLFVKIVGGVGVGILSLTLLYIFFEMIAFVFTLANFTPIIFGTSIGFILLYVGGALMLIAGVVWLIRLIKMYKNGDITEGKIEKSWDYSVRNALAFMMIPIAMFLSLLLSFGGIAQSLIIILSALFISIILPYVFKKIL